MTSVSINSLRFVLVRPSHPANIGAAARAIRTMGFSRLVLVAPRHYPHAEATAMASGAEDVLASVKVVPDLLSAIGDCRLAIGCTARQRGVALLEYSPREGADRLCQTALDNDEVAIVFGNERSGLENNEIQRCHAAIRIPSVADFPSLNLAQAVQVLAYELRLSWLSIEPTRAQERLENSEPTATIRELENFFMHLSQTLEDIDFHKGRPANTVSQRLRRLFLRTDLTQREVRILRGILDDAQRMARIARDL